MRLQHGLNNLWSWLGEDRRIVEILVFLLFLNALVFIIPQTPVAHDDSVAQLRWLAQASVTWPGPLRVLDALHLTRIRTSMWLRIPLAWLSLVTAVHIDKLRTQWESMDSRKKIKALIGKVGSLLVLTGWALQLLLGWTVPALTAWPDSPMQIPERNLSIPTCSQWACIWPGKMGLYLLPSSTTIGVDVQAQDNAGHALDLVPGEKTDPQLRLQIALTEPVAETFFLIPDVERIVQINQHASEDGQTALRLQVYDFQSGVLLVEQTISPDTIVRIGVDLVSINVAVRTLSQYDAVYNPGAVVELSGFAFLVVGLFFSARQSATQEGPQEVTDKGEERGI